MNYPKIRIKNAWLLKDAASVHLHELWAEPGQELPGDEKLEEIVEAYREAWKPYEKKVIEGMCEILGLDFRQNTIDVYIAPWFLAFSDPMVIGIKSKPDRFVDILTHEILHRLLTDNTRDEYPMDYVAKWEKLFGKDHSFVTLVHIPVHAAHKALLLDVLDEPKRLERDIALCSKHEDYKKAWEYVEKNGYKEIIEKLIKGD